MAKVLVYTKENCSFCERAKFLLQRLKIPYDEKKLHTQDEFMKLKSETGWMTFPQIFINGKLIGGFQDLARIHESGELEKLLVE